MILPKPVEFIPEGYSTFHTSCGIKDSTVDLGVVISRVPANVAGLFTQNAFVGEPIKIGRQVIQRGQIQGVVVNSKNANVATGIDGYNASIAICEKAAGELSIEKDLILPSSTGVIGRPLPLEKIIHGLDGLKGNLQSPPDFPGFAKAIMTTDTHPKYVSAKVGKASIIGVAKGSGMIEPNMATMLSYFFTDAEIDREILQNILKRSADRSFNCLSVDSDTSTSDTLVMMANGLAGKVDQVEFEETIGALSTELTRMIARDGEGATKLFVVDVINSESFESARKIGKSIINSPLVKTMIYQGDPNWGRIYMAIGKTYGVNLSEPDIKIIWGSGENITSNDMLHKYLKENEELHLTIDMGTGNSSCRVYGCDLTEEYVRINAFYTT